MGDNLPNLGRERLWRGQGLCDCGRETSNGLRVANASWIMSSKAKPRKIRAMINMEMVMAKPLMKALAKKSMPPTNMESFRPNLRVRVEATWTWSMFDCPIDGTDWWSCRGFFSGTPMGRISPRTDPSTSHHLPQTKTERKQRSESRAEQKVCFGPKEMKVN